MILGEDWLEEVSPMWVDRKAKVMRFTYQGQRIELRGLGDDISQCTEISALKLQGLFRHHAVVNCIQLHLIQNSAPTLDTVASIQQFDGKDLPHQVASLIREYAQLFEEPTTLPPQRFDDHQIPLIPGAHPVQVRPYRYSLA